jgi:hypothetical protein
MTIKSNLYVEKVISEHPIAVWMLNEQVDYLSLISETNRQIYNTGQWTVTSGTAIVSSTTPADVPFSSSATTRVDISSNINATVTNAVGNGTTITYTATNSFVAGEVVDITGLTVTTGLSLNLSNAIIATATGSQFTVTNQTIGTATSQSGLARVKVVAKSVFDLPTNLMDSTLSNFAIGGHIYISSSFITSFSFGYQYDDGISGITYYVEESNTILSADLNFWKHFSHTFEQPPIGATNVKMFIRVNVTSGTGSFYINGLSLGQWSEEYNNYSLGVTTSSIPSNISLPNTINVIEAPAYSSYDKFAYYCSGASTMYAKNFGIPLVYGSSNVTKIYPNVISNVTYPSLIFPGYGFLNQSGKYNEYTAEMWISLNSDAVNPRRVFGPISSTDGLYVEGGFLTLVIGKKFKSHFVGEWYRPMLVHIRYVSNSVNVLLNGEEIINIPLTESELSFVSQYDNLGKSQDWLGFYTYSDIHPFSIDSFAIYSYVVPNEVAKRRFVWGQGITPPELENSSLNATTAFADYSFSNYAVNYNYPDFANWRQGFYSNVVTNRNSLELPQYTLPKIYLGSEDRQTWYDDIQAIVKPTETRTNLVENPSFETNTNGWSAYYVSTRNRILDSTVSSGSYSMSVGITNVASGVPNGTIYMPNTVLPSGTTVYVSAYIKGTPGRILRFGGRPEASPSGYLSEDNGGINVTLTGDWQRITTSYTYTGVPFKPGIQFYITSANFVGTDTFYLDKVQIQTGSLSNYFDGTYTEYDSSYEAVTTWTGTAGSSTSTVTYLSDINDVLGNKYFTFRPNGTWTDPCYFYFPKLRVLDDVVESIYGVFATVNTTTGQPLFKIINNQTQDYLSITVEGTYITYKVVIDGVTTDLKSNSINSIYPADTIAINAPFVVGINLTNFSLQDINSINKIFENQGSVSVYVGGDGTNTFTGKIYKIGFDANYNNRKVKNKYDSNGFSIYNQNVSMMAHTANYTLIPLEKYGTFFADISIAGYWEDYVPLSYFAKYIKDYDDNSQYDLDILQFNVDYPEPLETNAIESTSSWTYQDLFNEFNSPDILSYEDLGNTFFTTWEDYEDISQASVKYYYYDTTAANVRTFVSFQQITDGANKNLVDFINTDVPRAKGVIDTELVSLDWEDTAFEVVDGTIIYPPARYKDNTLVNFNDLGIVSHVEFKVDGILHNPVRLRNLQLASQVYERTKFTEIGTKYGVPVYPYHKTGIYYDFKGKNPVELYKDSTPHLFLTRHSGWKMRGDFSVNLDRGIAIPVNTENALDVKISSLQLWLKYAEKEMPNVEMRIFSIVYKGGTYDFYLTGDSSTQRGFIYAKDRDTDAIFNELEYHINGQLIDTPYLVNEEWHCLGIAFPGLIDFDEYVGRITLNGPLTYNNVSYSIATNLEQEQKVSYRSWGAVSSTGSWDFWQTWGTWSRTKITSTNNVYAIDPSDIFARYVGTNRIIIDDTTDGILFDPEKIRVYIDIGWSTSVKTAV